MQWWQAGLWGLCGGGAIELIDLYHVVRTADGRYGLPRGGEDFWKAYSIAVAIRLFVGFITAWALDDANQIETAIAALGAGAGATGFLEHVSRGPRPAEPEV